ncbi:MAG: cupin domain-containing protein [Pygmaiobacter sp.]
MLRKQAEMQTVIRENIKGGQGAIAQMHLIRPEEMSGYARHCAVMTLAPGDSIGAHDHAEEAEFFYLLEGELVTLCDEKEVPFVAGDASFTTGAGNRHMLQNRSGQPAKVLAIVMTPKTV